MELLKPIIDSESAETLLGPYLHSCQEQLAFLTQDASEERSLITTINCKLNEPSTRFIGLSLLHTFLQSCPQSTVNDNAISWMSLCVKGSVSPVASTCNLSYQVLGELIGKCSDQAKHVASAVLPKLFEHLQSVPKHCIFAALICLESCMKVYNGSCGPHKSSIQRFLYPLLEYTGPNKIAVVWKASVCIALLPQLGGGGAGGVTHQENWTKQLKTACSTLHEILDALFSSVHQLEVHNVEATRGATFPLNSIQEEDPIIKSYALVARFEGVLSCVQAMLLGEFGVVKNVPPSAVLSVICRGLAVTSMSLQTTSTTESLILLKVLPTLQTKLLELMRALIDCCGANLLPFSKLVVKLNLQTLKWTQVKDWKNKTNKPYRCLRTTAYLTMKHWLDCVQAVPSCEEVAELVDIASADFRSDVDRVRLLAGKKKNKYADRNEAKRKRALNASPASASASAPLPNAEMESDAVDPAANKAVCIAALQTVQALLACHGWALNAGSYTTLHETAVKLVVSVSCQPPRSLVPYGDAAARLELYRLFSSLVSHPHPHVAAPIRMAWRLFSLGQNDPNFQVSTFCSQALSTLEKIVHPSFVPLALPIPEMEEGKTANDELLASSSQLRNTKLAEVKAEANNKKKRKSSPAEQPAEERSEPSADPEVSDEAEVSKEAPAEEKVSNGDQEMIDVSDSGSNGADIEEVPVEIDLADSEASDEAEPAQREATDGILIVEDDRCTPAEDFRLALSPEPESADREEPSRRKKRRGEGGADDAKERRVVANSVPVNGKDDGEAPPPAKVVVVSQDVESDVESMLASFVDKVKPIYDEL